MPDVSEAGTFPEEAAKDGGKKRCEAAGYVEKD